jgi:hypothetical protein
MITEVRPSGESHRFENVEQAETPPKHKITVGAVLRGGLLYGGALTIFAAAILLVTGIYLRSQGMPDQGLSPKVALETALGGAVGFTIGGVATHIANKRAAAAAAREIQEFGTEQGGHVVGEPEYRDVTPEDEAHEPAPRGRPRTLSEQWENENAPWIGGPEP